MQKVHGEVFEVPEDPGTAIDLRAVIKVLWRGKYVIALSVLVCLAVAMAYLATRTPTYEAGASVLIDRGAGPQLDIRTPSEGPLNDAMVNSQINVILSNRVLGRVVDNLGLASDPLFVPPLREDTGGFSQSDVRLLIGRVVAPVLGEIPYLSPPNLALTLQETMELHRRLAIINLGRRIRATQLGSSFVIRVSASAPSPALAAQLANAVVAAYVEFLRSSELEVSVGAARWLNERIADLELQVRRSTDAVDAFRMDFAPSEEAQVEERTAQLDLLRSSLSEIRDSLAALRTEREDATEAALRALDERIADLASREAALQASAIAAESELARLVRQRAEFTELQRRALADRRLYERFLDEANIVGALETYQSADARIIADALKPLEPSNPGGSIVVALASVLGAGFGIAIVALLELLTTTFRAREELADFTGLPVVGVLPRHQYRANPVRLLSSLNRRPPTDIAESARAFRSAVLRRQSTGRVLLVTSARAQEGKSTTALLLAATAADLGRRALLIEGDLSHSRLGAALGLKPKATLAAVLSGEADVKDAIVPHKKDGFDVLVARRPGEGMNGSPLDLLASAWMDVLMTTVREEYDLVVIDTPPVLPCADASVLAHHADGVLVVVRWRRTQKAALKDAIRTLISFGATIDGLVFNGVDRRIEALYRDVPHHPYTYGS